VERNTSYSGRGAAPRIATVSEHLDQLRAVVADMSPAPEAMAAYLAKGWGYYLVAAVCLHFVIVQVPHLLFPGKILVAAIWGIAFTHYTLDAKIWHVRGDQELATALRI